VWLRARGAAPLAICGGHIAKPTCSFANTAQSRRLPAPGFAVANAHEAKSVGGAQRRGLARY